MEFETQPQPEKGNLLKIILEVIGGILILSIFLMLVYFSDSISKIIKEQASLQKGEVAKEEEPPQVTLPKVLYNLAGPIQQLGVGMLVLEAEIPQLTETGEVSQKIESRKVFVTASTKFSRLTFVAQAGNSQKTPQETVIAFKDLKVKDYIEVVSNQDISQAAEFTAVQIRILPR